jgi:hypothetical protein
MVNLTNKVDHSLCEENKIKWSVQKVQREVLIELIVEPMVLFGGW